MFVLLIYLFSFVVVCCVAYLMCVASSELLNKLYAFGLFILSSNQFTDGYLCGHLINIG